MLIMTCLLLGQVVYADEINYPSVWDCNQSDVTRFNWYCKDEAVPATPPPPKPVDVTTLKTAEAFRKVLSELKDKMTMEPTEQNVKNFMVAQQVMFEKSATLSDVWRRVVWTTPELDYSLRRPVNNAAIQTFNGSQNQAEASYLQGLAREHGLLFFFRSNCPYCHQMAPTLKRLSQQYGIEILPISLDGGGLPDFPNPKMNQGQAQKLGIERVPALFIASRKTGDMAPIGYGVLSSAEIVNRIFVLTNTQPGQSF